MNGCKLKCNSSAIQIKLKASEHIEKSELLKHVCDELSIGKSTVNDWQGNKKTLKKYCLLVE